MPASQSQLLFGAQTTRTKFRRLEPEDFEVWKALFELPDTRKFLGMSSGLTSQQQCEKWFEISFNRYKEGLSGMNVMIDKATGKFVGQCGLLIQTVNGQPRLEVGYSIHPDFHRKGYAKEAAVFLRDLAFEKSYDKAFGNSLVSVIHHQNQGSINVALHNGMTREAAYEDDKNPECFVVYSISRITWEELKAKR
ncbi:GNAT family N-acetyltransferase [Nonlabens xiamenensis]|uniref:GNAT family N-acetyltransferase n=1 Tax=Nonlabens xiamenensis TaxID=2341043 RepID=UPI000F6088FD|nr:GNAT family N-acetyltransferase [Nonlabens xiamenensis]